MEQKLALDVKEAAQALSISPWTVRRMIADGRLKATRFSRRVLIEPSELEKLLERGRGPMRARERPDAGR